MSHSIKFDCSTNQVSKARNNLHVSSVFVMVTAKVLHLYNRREFEYETRAPCARKALACLCFLSVFPLGGPPPPEVPKFQQMFRWSFPVVYRTLVGVPRRILQIYLYTFDTKCNDIYIERETSLWNKTLYIH